MTSTDVLHKLKALETSLNAEILERRPEIHTAMLAIVGRKHHFQLGPPGTAKSLLVDRISKRIDGLGEDGYFRWLLTRYTSPEEIYGGPDFTLLREHGVFKRVTKRKLPRAYFVFKDEIFKANSSILNAGLTAMNEREFYNADDDPRIPLITLFAASNELPQGEELWAMWDRLHFRHVIRPMQESSSFIKMLSVPMDKSPEPLLTLEDIFHAHGEVDRVTIPTEVFEAMLSLKNDLKMGVEGVGGGIEATERRWVESLGIIKSEAYWNGREVAEVEDMRPLMHVLWSDQDHIKIVKKLVLEMANPIDRAASDLFDRICNLEIDLRENLSDGEDNVKEKARVAVEVQKKMGKAYKTLGDLESQQKASGRHSEYLGQAQGKFLDVARSLYADGFGVDVDKLSTAKVDAAALAAFDDDEDDGDDDLI